MNANHTIPAALEHLPRPTPCPSWCADKPDPRTHPELHQSLTTSVEFPDEDVYVNLEQPAYPAFYVRPYVNLHRGDEPLFTAPPAAMRSLAAQLVAAADVLEGLPGLGGRVR